MRGWKKILLALLIVVVFTPAIIFAVLQIQRVQTSVCQNLAEKISEKVNGTVTIGEVRIGIPYMAILNDVTILENTGDTLAHLGKLSVRIDPSTLMKQTIDVSKIQIKDGFFTLRHVDEDKTNLDILLEPLKKDGSKKEKPEKDSTATGFSKNVTIDRLLVENVNVALLDEYKEKQRNEGSTSIDYSNLIIDSLYLNARDISLSDRVTLSLESLHGRERGHLEIRDMSGDISFSGNDARIDNLHFDDGLSDINAEYLNLSYDSLKDFSDFVNKVKLDANLKGTYLDFKSLKSFSEADLGLKLFLDGEVHGTVSRISTKGLKVKTGTGGSELDVSASINGLPDLDFTILSIRVNQLKTTTKDIANQIKAFSPQFNTNILTQYAKGEVITFSGKMDGLLSDFVADGRFKLGRFGYLDLDAVCRQGNDGLNIIGNIKGTEIDLGSILENETLGKLSFDTKATATLGNKLVADVEPLNISKLGLLGYEYSGISAVGKINGKDFDGRIICSDPNLNFLFHGLLGPDETKGDTKYKFDMSVGYADLHALNLDKRDISKVSFQAEADVKKTKDNVWLGQASLGDIKAELENASYDVGDVNMRALMTGNIYNVALRSTFANLRYRGSRFIGDFVKEVMHLAAKDELDHIFKGYDHSSIDALRGNEYTVNMTTLNMRPLCEFLMPGLYIGDSTSVNVKLDKSEHLNVSVRTPLVAFNNNYFKDVDILLTNPDNQVKMDFDAGLLKFGNLEVTDNDIFVTIDDNDADVRVEFNNGDSGENKIALHTNINFLDQEVEGHMLRADIFESDLKLYNGLWTLSPSTVLFAPKDIHIDNFRLTNGAQYITADGKMSDKPEDTLNVSLNKFDISLINPLMKNNMDFQGTLTGKAAVYNMFGDQFGFLADIKGDKVSMGGNLIGDMAVGSRWNPEKQGYDILLDSSVDGTTTLSAGGLFSPESKSLDIDVSLDKFGVGIIEPFVTGIVDHVTGSLSGDINVKGPLDKLKIKSEGTRFNDFGIRLDFTNVFYTLDGPFSIDDKGVKFNRVKVSDKYGHDGTVTGGLTYDMFKDIKLDTRINFTNILGINTSEADNESFYGRAFATGRVRLTGPMDKLALDINISTEPNSTLHIPLGASAKEQNNLLTFINTKQERLNAYDSLVILNAEKVEEKASGSGIAVQVTAKANPNAEIDIDINRSLGDVLKARGDGTVNINIGEDLFDIKGNYVLSEGSYRFVLMGLASRDFIINPGGTINFNGDIMNSDLNLTATYRTKASIGTLIADTTSVSSRRTVDCGIGITGKLANPQLNFNIDIPDLDPDTKSRVESALSTEDKRLKQMLTLLLSGSFMPDSESGIVNNTTVLYSNASEIMANQVNNILRQLEIPVDLGFNYQPGQNGKSLFDVAISTQLFNNRVTINGSVGNRQYISASGSDVVGDVDVEIKLNQTGKIRLKLFSHSADAYSNYLDQSQRNGAGVVYQEEFDTWQELWRKIFWSKARKEEYEKQLRQEAMERYRNMMENRTPRDSTLVRRDSTALKTDSTTITVRP